MLVYGHDRKDTQHNFFCSFSYMFLVFFYCKDMRILSPAEHHGYRLSPTEIIGS